MKQRCLLILSILFLFLGYSIPVAAGELSCPAGALASAQTATGASTHIVIPIGARAVAFQYVINSGVGATVETQICCTDSCGASGDWAQVTNSSLALVLATAPTKVFKETSPACAYRTNVTACDVGGCSVDTFFTCSVGGQ